MAGKGAGRPQKRKQGGSDKTSQPTSQRAQQREQERIDKEKLLEIQKHRRNQEEDEVANDWFGQKDAEQEGEEKEHIESSSEEEGDADDEEAVQIDGEVFRDMEDDEDDEDDSDYEEEEGEDDDNDDDDETSDDGIEVEEEDDSSTSFEESTNEGLTKMKTQQRTAKAETTKTINEQRELEGEYGSSDEEIERNATGDVPLEWYTKTFDHIGYDRAGEKIVSKGDADAVARVLLARGDSKEAKEFRRSVYDARNDEVTVLTDRELVMVRRMLEGKFPHPEFEAEAEYVPYFSGVPNKTSMSAAHEPKSRFIPSKWERMKVEKIVRGIQDGSIKVRPDRSKMDEREEAAQRVYMLWGEDGQVEDKDEMMRRRRRTGGHIPAPKMTLPGHKESYHPSPEYLLTPEELAQIENGSFVPKDTEQMRKLGAYPDFVRERFERCLDLYLCARKQKVKLNIDPESLVPRLPLPRELRPFPTTNAVQYLGHSGRVRSSAVDPMTGEFMCTGGDDGDIRVWDVESGRCISKMRLWDEGLGDTAESIVKLAWNPRYRGIIAACSGSKVHICYVGLPVAAVTSGQEEEEDEDEEMERDPLAETVRLLSGAMASEEEKARTEEEIVHEKRLLSWEVVTKIKSVNDLANGTISASILKLQLTQGDTPVDLCWHGKGEFLCTVSASSSKTASRVLVHHVGKRKSQEALKKLKGDPQCAVFHPDKPVLFIATKTHVIAHHLTKQTSLKKLRTGVKWISSIAIHPKGDHLVIGSYDCRVVWFDLDLSSKPFKTMKYHGKAVRRVCFHRRYPLMASCSDDGTVNVFHTTVYADDLTRNPLIVPVKRIEAHDVVGGRGVLDCVFHPTQPWIFTSGADGLAVLFSNIP